MNGPHVGRKGGAMMPLAQAERALRVRDREQLVAALNVLAGLAARQPLEYEPVVDEAQDGGTYAIVVPAWAFEAVSRDLEANGIEHHEMPVRSAADLPPLEQAQRRGWVRE